MRAFRQWLGCLFFLAAIPTAAIDWFVRTQHPHEGLSYAVTVPALLIYFCIMGLLGLDVPGEASSPSEDATVYILGRDVSRRKPAGRIAAWLQTLAYYLLLPMIGLNIIFQGVRNDQIAGLVLGPLMIWCSGAAWVLTVQFLIRKRRESREEE